MKTNMTIGEKYSPAMEITDQAKADAYFEECVQHTLKHLRAEERPDSDIAPKTLRQKAESIERQNLGYYAGYYDSKTRERVERLFKCQHPIFGSIATNGAPTTKEALAAGMVAAKSGVQTAAKVFAV